jgi:hypothetical protein
VTKGKKIVVGFAAGLALVGAGFFSYFELVKAGLVRYNRYDRREKGILRVGDTAPDLALTMYDGSPVRLSELWQTQPVFLIFGSCT